jgi:multicomponent Na+:H+ antiporter subunit D
MSVDLIFAATFAVLALGIVLYAVSVPQGGRAWWALATLIVLLAIAGELTSGSLIGTICLDLAELAGVALIWSHRTTEAEAAARSYLYAILPGIACTLLALALMGEAGNRPALLVEDLIVFLIILGFALKLGLIPFYFWLPAVASAAPPMTTALIVSVVDIATLVELVAIRQTSPWLFTEHAAIWMIIALLSMFGGALLALAQTELKRMLAFSTIADLGFLLVGLIAGGSVGISGVWIGALSHALSKIVLFGAVGLAEVRIGRTVTLDTSGLGAQLPWASAAFIAAALSFIGVPPGFGFGGYWRIYIAATQFGGPTMIVGLLATAALDLLCYARAIHRTWLGPAQIPIVGTPARLASGVVMALAVVAVLLGCYPSILTTAVAPDLLAMVQ